MVIPGRLILRVTFPAARPAQGRAAVRLLICKSRILAVHHELHVPAERHVLRRIGELLYQPKITDVRI